MSLLDAKSEQWKRLLERVATARDSRPYSYSNKLRSNAMNSPMAGVDTDQKENQLASAVRHATGNLERVEVLRDKLYQMLDRLRGPEPPKAAPNQVEEKLTETGTMPRLVRQHERTTTAIEEALQHLNEVEQYV